MKGRKTFTIVAILVYLVGLYFAFAYPNLWVPLILIALYFIITKIIILVKNRKTKEPNIPADVMQDFMKAERRFEEDGGKTQPTTILWDIANERRSRRYVQDDPRVTVPIASISTPERYNVQTNTNSENGHDIPRASGNEVRNNKSLFKRKRGRPKSNTL